MQTGFDARSWAGTYCTCTSKEPKFWQARVSPTSYKKSQINKLFLLVGRFSKLDPCKMLYTSNVVTEIRRRAYRGLETTRSSAGAGAVVGCCILVMFVWVSGSGPWALFKQGSMGLFAQESFSAMGGVTTESCFPKYPRGLGWIHFVFALASLIRAVFRDTLICLRAPWEHMKRCMLLHLSSTENYLYHFRSEKPSEDAFFSLLKEP